MELKTRYLPQDSVKQRALRKWLVYLGDKEEKRRLKEIKGQLCLVKSKVTAKAIPMVYFELYHTFYYYEHSL